MSIAQRHYENFPTASKLIHKDLRPAVAAIYAFARHADDLADEGDAPAKIRIKQLDAWEALLDRCVDEPLEHPIFLALGDAIRRFGLPVEELRKLLIAFRMDVSLLAYASEDELIFYCAHSANPIGRLMLALHGINDVDALQASDALCTALQWINFWQDLSIDLPRRRCYLPETWLAMQGLSTTQLLDWAEANALGEHAHNQAVKNVLRHAVRLTRERLAQGYDLMPHLPWRLRLQVAATLQGGLSMLDKIEQLEQPLAQRATLDRRDWRRLAFHIAADAWLPGHASSTAATILGSAP